MGGRFGENFGIRYLFRMVCKYPVLSMGRRLMIAYRLWP